MDNQITIQLDDTLAGKLERLALMLNRSESWLTEQAIHQYIQEQSWQMGAIGKAMSDYRTGTKKLIPHETVMERLGARFRAET